MYKKRFIEESIERAASFFKVILVTGARQIGKSTVLKNLYPDYTNIVLSPHHDQDNIKNNPAQFLAAEQNPVIFDEFQFFPELTSYLKLKVDKSDARGQYFLTGSQNITMLKNVAETMTGRVGIINMHGMSIHEAFPRIDSPLPGKSAWLSAYLDNPDNIADLARQLLPTPSLYDCIWRGNLPESILAENTLNLPMFFDGYLSTYIERDIRLLFEPSELRMFQKFLGMMAILTAQEVNFSHLGREVGFTAKTMMRWASMLSQTYQWRELPVYHANTLKRVTKRPKGHFTDTGIACHMQQINSPRLLSMHPNIGRLFETWAVNEIEKQSGTLLARPEFYHWRTDGGAEVDLIISYNGTLYPVEMKIANNVSGHDTRGIQSFRKTYPKANIAHGLVIYGGQHAFKINDFATALPWNASVS